MPQPREAPRQALTTALRRLRRSRGLRARDVALAMGLPLRTYVHFEAGGSQASPERLRRFAGVIDCDYAALLLCAGGLDAELVLASADNKAVSVAVAAVDELHASLPGVFARLSGPDLACAFDRVSRHLQITAPEDSRARGGESPRPRLTPRQLECLAWAQAGKSSTDIGLILGLSHRTVDAHLATACARLGVRTRIQAISRAIELGLLSSRSP